MMCINNKTHTINFEKDRPASQYGFARTFLAGIPGFFEQILQEMVMFLPAYI